MVKPLLEPPDPEREESARRRGPQERVQDVDSAFSVEPQCGLLPPNGVGQFILTFAPPLVSTKATHSWGQSSVLPEHCS